MAAAGGSPGVDVVVVPVAVRHDGAALPTLMAWPGSDGRWARREVLGSAAVTAGTLLDECLPPGASVLGSRLRAEPVTFIEDRRQLVLLYSAALPMALCDPGAPDADRWVALLHPEKKALHARHVGEAMLTDAPFTRDIVDHWRQALEETGAALRFLARYWTLPQLRDVYSAVWGYEQDTAGFTKWALRNPGVFKGLQKELPPDTDLNEELAEALAEADAFISGADAGSARRARKSQTAEASDNTSLWSALARTIKPATAVGLSLVAGPLPAVILAAAAGAVAYQTSTRGRAPAWHKTTVDRPEDHQHEQLYVPRPAWLTASR